LLSGIAARAACAAPEARDDPALDAAFQTLTRLELGQDLQQFHGIELAVVQSRSDATVRTDLEARLIAVLQGAATDLAKDYACRQLALVGSDASVPALAALLPNPRLSPMARYALEGLGSPAAATALRDAMDKTEGRQKVGVVISLGRLADAEAAAPIAALLATENAELREVALVALGRIGTVPAAEALREFAGRAPEALRGALVDAELDAAESLCQRGLYATAIAICESLQASDSERVRAAAFRGLLAAKPAESLTMTLAGLAAEEPWKQAVAADCLMQFQRPEELSAIAAAVPNLPTPGKIATFVSLKDRRDPSVRAAALKSIDEPDAAVRTAALTALIASGTAEDVPTLIGLAATAKDLAIRDAAFETLRLMPAVGTNQALLALMDQDTDVQPVAVRCALARRSSLFVPSFLKAAASSNVATRRQAFTALEIMATPAETEALVRLLCKTLPGEEREAADRAVWMSCQQIPDPAARSALLHTLMAQVDAAGKCAILPTLARMGGAESLAAVHEAMRSTDQAVRDAGYRALANWPDDTVAGELLDIAKSSEADAYRIWSLRAFARVVSLPSERPPQTTFEMLSSAMDLATRTEDKELIVSRLASVRVPDALARLLTYVDQPELRNAAVPAAFTLAKGLSQSHPEQARAALEKIGPLTEDAAILQQIPRVLRDIDARK
jgi:HEAT repeat protein